MQAFVRAEPHFSAMRDLRRRAVIKSGEFRSWEADAGTPLPSWHDVELRFAQSAER
jgi:hypothetical protein